jgi:hypothetical protein
MPTKDGSALLLCGDILVGKRSDPGIYRHMRWQFIAVPLPVPNLRQVLTVLVDVMLMLNQLVPHLLFQIGTWATQLRQPIDHVLHQMKAV